MPTYPYACTECGHQFETRQSFSDDPLTDCPECSGRLRKVWGSVGVVFKGSGFYRTDSRGSSGSSTASSDSTNGSGDSKSKSESTTKSDSSASSSAGSSSTTASAGASSGS